MHLLGLHQRPGPAYFFSRHIDRDSLSQATLQSIGKGSGIMAVALLLAVGDHRLIPSGFETRIALVHIYGRSPVNCDQRV